LQRKLILDHLEDGKADKRYFEEYIKASAALQHVYGPGAEAPLDFRYDKERLGKAELAIRVGRVVEYIKSSGDAGFLSTVAFLRLTYGLDPQAWAQTQVAITTWLLALTELQDRTPVWKLDTKAYDALMGTEMPKELLADELPRLPFSPMLIVLPDDRGITLDLGIPGLESGAGGVEQMSTPGMMRMSRAAAEHRHMLQVTSVLLNEDIPGKKWRIISIQDRSHFAEIATGFAWINTELGNLANMLPEYAESGDNAIWRLLINLFLALDHGYMTAQPISPTRTTVRGATKKRKQEHSSWRDYVVIDLARKGYEERERLRNMVETSEEAGKRASPYEHDVRGHISHYWVIDPQNEKVLATKERENRRPLYKTRVWILPHRRGDPTRGRPGERTPGRREYRVTASSSSKKR
jgi:hypothetical protein